ncbi:hypothetical protein DVY42_12865 [Enterococcus faecium]|nr:hypothetical protein CYQ59_13175 [Enterococcus faecium]RXX02137.1 hypothetical protein CYQ55_12365 [Enterococcus faecium]TKN37389.1 hypothetical protein DVW91_12740 [Enterococcus faecium]TKO77070.1 hypothetical protein DVY42_12865 [Enterococcus faecium]
MSLKTLYRKRTVIWPFYFYTIIRTLSLAGCSTKEVNIYIDMDFSQDMDLIFIKWIRKNYCKKHYLRYN